MNISSPSSFGSASSFLFLCRINIYILFLSSSFHFRFLNFVFGFIFINRFKTFTLRRVRFIHKSIFLLLPSSSFQKP
eukprot:UN33833